MPDIARVSVDWRGALSNTEVNRLHAEAFETRPPGRAEWDWETLLGRHSAGWVVARQDTELVGFANVVWDGRAHAWLQDVMVAASARGAGIGIRLVRVAADGARSAGCEWLHVDFEGRLAAFYIESCGFRATNAGLLRL